MAVSGTSMVVGGRAIDVARAPITDAGRRGARC
jgi:hypothetical protein